VVGIQASGSDRSTPFIVENKRLEDSAVNMKNGLLLGAGFSYDLGMPLTIELAEVFWDVFTDELAERMAKVMSLRQPFGADRPVDRKAIMAGWDLLRAHKRRAGKNYEDFLAELEYKAHLGSPTQPKRDSYHSLFD
jgi:hypothetical protein